MRTTIDLDDSLLKRLRDEAHVQEVPFRTLLHWLLQRGLDQGSVAPAVAPYNVPSFSLGQVREGIDLVKALELASTFEDEEIVRKIAQRRWSVIIPDVNLLLYATQAECRQHTSAATWLKKLLSGDEPVGMPCAVSIGFVRLNTNRRISPSALAIETALEVVDEWYCRRIVVPIAPGEQHWRLRRELLLESGAAGNLTSDAHLAALRIERGATLHSADADFGRFRGLRWVNPLTPVR